MKKLSAVFAALMLVITFVTPAQSAGVKYTVYQKTLATFSSSATGLTSQQKAQVKATVEANPDAEKFICTGIRYFSQPMSINIMVRKRAKAACEYAKELNPNLSTWYQNKPTKARSYAGKVLLTVKSPSGVLEAEEEEATTQPVPTDPTPAQQPDSSPEENNPESSPEENNPESSPKEECDPSSPHPKGAFEFAPQVDESLPQQWHTEFEVILANLQQVAPISQCIHDYRNPSTGALSVQSPMSIYAWNSAVDNPWSEERPGMGGASISGDGFDTWMVLEIPEDEFKYDYLHRYSVVAHEYWHVYQIGAWRAQGLSWPDWMWEGGAKVVEELYIAEHYGRSQFDQNLHPVIATALSNPADFERRVSGGGAVGGESDINYNTSAFMVLALAAELQDTLNIPEEEAFRLVLTAPAAPESETPFLDLFGMTPAEFYSSLSQYPAMESGEDWFEGDVIDASDVMPSKDLTLERILESSP